MDRIEFRSHDRDLPWSEEGDLEAAVEILVNGVTLDSIWAAAGGSDTLPLSAEDLLSVDHLLWGELLEAHRWLIEDGRVAILTCTCTCFGCGGATARITFTSDTVTWSDFHEANRGQRVNIRPFTFLREDYEAALLTIGSGSD